MEWISQIKIDSRNLLEHPWQLQSFLYVFFFFFSSVSFFPVSLLQYITISNLVFFPFFGSYNVHVVVKGCCRFDLDEQSLFYFLASDGQDHQ